MNGRFSQSDFALAYLNFSSSVVFSFSKWERIKPPIFFLISVFSLSLLVVILYLFHY
jgi:hypothetical protein